MSKPSIELISNESGDWSILRMNLGEDFEYSGHNIHEGVWIKLLEKLGYEVQVKEVNDEEMENMCWLR